MSAAVFDWRAYKLAARRERIMRAREDVNAFIEHVGDGSGMPIYQEDVHREWQSLFGHYDKTVLLAPVGSGKTVQTRMAVLHAVGRDPDQTRVAYISQSEDHPKKQASAIKDIIEKSDECHEVFPHLRRSKALWASKSFTVQRKTMYPDPTLQVYGVYGKILGSRKNIIIIDDLCSFVNTLTAVSRDKMFSWLAEVLSRLKGQVKVIAIGHIWHAEDALQRLAFTKKGIRRRGWTYARYEATRTLDDGSEGPTLPRVLPPEKIKELYDDAGPVFGQMMLWNRLPASTTSRFHDSWMQHALAQGRGTGYWSYRERPCEIVTGVDLGHKKKAGKDLTVMVTVALDTVDGRSKRRVVDVRAGRWKGPEIIREMQDLRDRFQTTFFVEDNGGQQYIADFAEDDADLPVPCYTSSTTGTGSQGKYDMKNGVEGALGGELKLGMWIFPCNSDEHPTAPAQPPYEIGEMIKGAHSYNPRNADEHTSDWLMAWWYAWKGSQMLRPRHQPAPDQNTLRR